MEQTPKDSTIVLTVEQVEPGESSHDSMVTALFSTVFLLIKLCFPQVSNFWVIDPRSPQWPVAGGDDQRGADHGDKPCLDRVQCWEPSTMVKLRLHSMLGVVLSLREYK